MSTVLIVDDDADFREGLAETLHDLEQETLEAASPAAAFEILAEWPCDAVFLDLRLGGADGLDTLVRIRELPNCSAIPVVVLTGFASSHNTIAAMKLGAFDHLTKPVGRADIAAVLERALPARAAPSLPAGGPSDEPLIGISPAMREVQKLIGLAAQGDSTVLITGETGTGKEVVARVLHEHSRRAGKPFVAVNCAAIPADLLESELFGHMRGAFTGAVVARLGRFRDADGGIIFLDEIGDMALAMQAKILRALQERAITPVGSAREEPVDIRVIAATHHDLPRMVAEGTFREDLYYRLNVLPVHLPPLSRRAEDVIPLTEHFLRQLNAAKALSEDARRRLQEYAWPGNVRELKNVIERLSVIVRGPVIETQHLDFLGNPAQSTDDLLGDILSLDLPTAVAKLERAMIVTALAETNGNRTEAASRLKIHRQLLYAKMRKYGLGG